MYKVASAKAQDGARRFKLADLCSREFEPTDLERRENLKLKVAAIEREILSLPPKSARRAELGQEKAKLCMQMHEIQPAWKGPDLSDCLLKLIKSEVTKHQWAMWVKAAEQLKIEGEAMAEEAQRSSTSPC